MRQLVILTLALYFLVTLINGHGSSHDHHHHDHDHDHDHDHHDHDHDHHDLEHGHSSAHSHDHDHDHDHDHHHDDKNNLEHGHSSAHSHDHDHNHDHDHDHHHGHAHPHGHTHKHGKGKCPFHSSSDTKEKRSFNLDYESLSSFVKESSVQRDTILATLAVSILPIFIILIVPLSNKGNQDWLKTLLAFAVGGLLGDVFLHLIPHAIGHSHGDDHSHDHTHGDHSHHDHSQGTMVGLQILIGMFLFFVIEKFAVLNGRGHGHSHGHGEKKDEKKDKDQSKEIIKERLRVSAILNIIADTTHNFTDGLAIAASFMDSYQTGLGTTIAVLIHEFPHEIGDLAVLVQSGYTKTQVIFVQFLTAFGAFCGAIFGLYVGSAENSNWVLPFTAGGFLYIATADIIPQLFENTSLKQTIKEIIALFIGVGAMYLIAIFE